MVAVDVNDTVALGAKVLGIEDGNTEPALQHHVEQIWAHDVVGIFRRDGVEPPARVWSGDQLKVRLEAEGGNRRVAQESHGAVVD